MAARVGVRELRQDLSHYLERVKHGEDIVVTERGREVARLIPSGAPADRYGELSQRFGATVPVVCLEGVAARMRSPGAPDGITDAHLAAGRRERR